MLLVVIVALLAGIATDLIVSRSTKVNWLGSLIGIGVCGVVLVVGLGLAK